MRIIIIGGGVAAVEAAVAIRQYDQNSSIDIYTEENVLPYRRPLLPDLLSQTVTMDRLPIYPAEFYRQNNITLHLAEPAVGVDKTNQTVIFSNQQTAAYDRLLLAVGKTARKLSVSTDFPEKIFSLYTLSDVEKINQQLCSSSSVTVIGGGVLGVECASALLKRKIKVNIVEINTTVLHDILDEECAVFLQKKLLADSNLNIYAASSVEKIALNNGKISCFLTGKTKKTITSDFIITAIGVIDKCNWGFDLSTDRHLQVKNCRNIFAAGDCAVIAGKTNRYYKSARMQGRIAGENIAGKNTIYPVQVNECRSVFNDSSFYTAGIIHGENIKYAVEQDENCLKKLFYLQNKLVGCILVNDTADAGELYSIIRQHQDFFN